MTEDLDASATTYKHAFNRLVMAWIRRLRRDPQSADLLLQRVLDQGLFAVVDGDDLPHDVPWASVRQRRRCEIALLRLDGSVDVPGYLARNAEVSEGRGDPVAHFVRRGWHRMLNPSLDFDVWWYLAQYLDLSDAEVNPLVHYLLQGRLVGNQPLPPHPRPRPSTPPRAAGATTRRACLFAAFDVDGVVDEYVLDYLAEVNRFADVYYLADCNLSRAELAKLEKVTSAAWARRHGTYDFGSWAILARDLVGWDRLDTYDEVLLANDSCYLLQPLDDLFATMDARPCDWWGLQATKRPWGWPAGEVDVLTDEAVHAMIGGREWDQVSQLHVSSYFLCLRKPAFEEPGVRRLLDQVGRERLKSRVIMKYEIGLSRVLMNAGHHFETYVPGLWPYHPLYTSDFFTLAADGFPFLKRNFIYENALDAPDLASWKERLLAVVPDAPVEMFERNLLRVAPDDKLQRSFAIVTDEHGEVQVPRVLTPDEVAVLDLRTPTFDHWWGFPVCAYDHSFAGNERAVFEEVRDDPSIKKVIFTRSRKVSLTGENVEVLPLLSREGQEAAVRCGQIFVKHSPKVNMTYRLSPDLHNFVSTWHGIPLKRFGFAAVDSLEAFDDVVVENLATRTVVTSSKIDSLAMTAAFHPLQYQNTWPTGLPRNDLITRPIEALPEDLAAQQQSLVDELDGRRLVMFLPTFKRDQAEAYYRFAPDEIDWLAEWSRRHGAVIGLREHMADMARTYGSLLAPLDPVDLSGRRFPQLEVLYPVADALITDYSSCIVDFLLTGKPVISFAYDHDRYANEERGLFYELEQVLPGPVCRTFEELSVALDRVFTEPGPDEREDYEWKRRIFFDHLDDQSSWRLAQRVKGLYVKDAG